MSKKDILSVANLMQFGAPRISTLLRLLKHRMSKQEMTQYDAPGESEIPQSFNSNEPLTVVDSGYSEPVIPLTEIVIGAVANNETEEMLLKKNEKCLAFALCEFVAISVSMIFVIISNSFKRKPDGISELILIKIALLAALTTFLFGGLPLMNFVLSRMVKSIILHRLILIVAISFMLSVLILVTYAIIFL